LAVGIATGLALSGYLWLIRQPPGMFHLYLPPYYWWDRAGLYLNYLIPSVIGSIAGPWFVVRQINDPDHPNEKWTPPRQDG
jgi:hypothetical protein